jgi:hypothetical protein
MTFYSLLLFAHITGVLFLFAGLALEWALISFLRRNPDLAPFRGLEPAFLPRPAPLRPIVWGHSPFRRLSRRANEFVGTGLDSRIVCHLGFNWFDQRHGHRTPRSHDTQTSCGVLRLHIHGPADAPARSGARCFGAYSNRTGLWRSAVDGQQARPGSQCDRHLLCCGLWLDHCSARLEARAASPGDPLKPAARLKNAQHTRADTRSCRAKENELAR